MTVGDQIAMYMKTKHVTQTKMCEDLDLNQPFLSEVLAGKANPTKEYLDKICAYLHCELAVVPTKNWDEEKKKCIESPYYFYTTYCLVNGKPATTRLTEKEFNEQFKHLGE